MPNVDAGGTELYYERSGGGEPLLMIQGMSATRLAWGRPFLSELEQSFECIVFDNRGMGESGQAELPFTIADLAADTAGLLDALGLETVHVLGISMGGMIAQELALAHPERIRTLTIGASYCGGPSSTLMAPEDLQMLGAAAASGDRNQVFRAMWEINLSPGFREDNARYAAFTEMAEALPAPQPVVTVFARHVVVAGPPVQVVVTNATPQHIVARAAQHGVVAVVPFETIVAAPAVDEVIAGAADHQLFATH